MAEMHVSATDFRVHLKDWANQVARGGDAVVMVRHGLDMAVLISWQEYQEFARLAAAIEKGRPVEEPDEMDLDLLERIYEETAGAADDETLGWRSKARISIRSRRARAPPS